MGIASRPKGEEAGHAPTKCESCRPQAITSGKRGGGSQDPTDIFEETHDRDGRGGGRTFHSRAACMIHVPVPGRTHAQKTKTPEFNRASREQGARGTYRILCRAWVPAHAQTYAERSRIRIHGVSGGRA